MNRAVGASGRVLGAFQGALPEWRLDMEKSQIDWQNHRFKGCDVAPNGANIN
jgi:hypothetical protein